MSNKTKQWTTIIVMISLFAMIAFITNLCSPMSIIVKNQYGASNFLSQVGNYGNFIAYLVMGVPAGMLIRRFGYKRTALMALAVGIIGILVQWYSGQAGYGLYLIGAFISGCCMCMLNTVVNPMLNLIGGGGNKGNQLVQIGNVFNSAGAVAIYILMGALIADVTKAKISDATPALVIALAIFVVGFVVILFTHIQEPEQQPVSARAEKDPRSIFSFRHFNLGLLAIFFYGGIELGAPTYVLNYLTAAPTDPVAGLGMSATVAGLIVAVYWFMMLVGRLIGGAIGNKVSSRVMVCVASVGTLLMVSLGMLLPLHWQANVPGIDWANLNIIWVKLPVGIFAFILVGLFASVMWGGIFNLATEGLGKYTAMASGAFMTMVCGFAIMVALQGWVADLSGSYFASFLIVILCALYTLYYSLLGKRTA